MADENVPAPAPTRSDDQILPFGAWVPIGKKITPIDQAHQFVSPPSGDAIMDFVNEMGYTDELYFVSRMAVNNLYQPWRAILSMINQCLIGKTSGHDRPIYLVLQMLWAIQTFLADKANLGIATQKGKKTKPHVIPYCRFTKLIICYLGRTHNIHQRSASPFHLAKEDHRLGNLKFVPKGKEDEVFEMQIPKELITNNIRNASYFNAYLEMVTKHDRKIAAAEGGKKKSASKTDQSKKPATAKLPKPVSSKQSKPAPAKQSKPLVDEPDEEQAQPEPEPEPQGEQVDYDLQRGITQKLLKNSLLLKRRIPVIEDASTGPSAQPEDDTSTNIIYDTPSPTDAETSATTDKTNSEGDIEILNIGQAGSDLGKAPESRPPLERVLMEEDQAGPDPRQSHVALARPDPEPMHDDFVATMYPQIYESLKQPDEEHVHVENPLSSTGTLSSMKNLDAFTFGDQFFNDKPTKEEPNKANMETKVKSMVTVLIHRASSSVPPISKHVINITPPKPISSTTQAPIFTATIATIDKTVQGLSSRVFTLELRVLLHQINQTVNEVVKEAVQVALQAPLKECFQDLSQADMKEILRDWMFESGSYRYLPEHVALYEALEASMERDNRDAFLVEKDKSRKRRRDNQDPPPPPSKEPNQSKKKKHDSDASGSIQTPTQTSLAWKISDTRDAPSSSSKQKYRGHRCCPSSKDQAHTRLVEACSRGRKTGNTKTELGCSSE
ncbi:hypothetical protein Tco_1507817 [Tanacetum coccineum]